MPRPGAVDVEALAQVRALCRSGAVRSIRVSAGVSINELARAVGVDRAQISRWERAITAPSAARAARLGEVLNTLLLRRAR